MPDGANQQASLTLLLRDRHMTVVAQSLKVVLMILAVYATSSPVDRLNMIDFERAFFPCLRMVRAIEFSKV